MHLKWAIGTSREGFTRRLAAPDQVRVEWLDVLVGQTARYVEFVMEHQHVLEALVFTVLNEQRVGKQLSLQELLLVNRAIEEALELYIPEEVALEFTRKEVEFKVFGKVIENQLKD
jgi:hypothetical protein